MKTINVWLLVLVYAGLKKRTDGVKQMIEELSA